jgi:hypothetical protein
MAEYHRQRKAYTLNATQLAHPSILQQNPAIVKQRLRKAGITYTKKGCDYYVVPEEMERVAQLLKMPPSKWCVTELPVVIGQKGEVMSRPKECICVPAPELIEVQEDNIEEHDGQDYLRTKTTTMLIHQTNCIVHRYHQLKGANQ